MDETWVRFPLNPYFCPPFNPLSFAEGDRSEPCSSTEEVICDRGEEPEMGRQKIRNSPTDDAKDSGMVEKPSKRLKAKRKNHERVENDDNHLAPGPQPRLLMFQCRRRSSNLEPSRPNGCGQLSPTIAFPRNGRRQRVT
ncbi:hypothetical protein KIN20_018124 [Parelaphostrongylus tenuis]|uniref:Uncharacterized protein n=1 Tax=Parelaphostrongylus tenuis TaxID=148309 RepID=A0AAD5N1M8_PARTN|nr:hypothetical protein KIN20_018124 [Parelaphostrongylus tenuis]